MSETLAELCAIPPPEAIRFYFESMYELMEQFAKDVEEPFTLTPRSWIHQVEQQPSLIHCTFALER